MRKKFKTKTTTAATMTLSTEAIGMDKPVGWNWRSPWWDIQNGEAIMAMIMVSAFFGTLYFLWHGLGSMNKKVRVLYFTSSFLCFITMAILGFKGLIIVHV